MEYRRVIFRSCNDLALATVNGIPWGVKTYVASIGYNNLAALVINGGNSPNTYNVQSTAAGTPTTINAGNSADNVIVGNVSSSLADIQGALTLDGQADTNYLTFND